VEQALTCNGCFSTRSDRRLKSPLRAELAPLPAQFAGSILSSSGTVAAGWHIFTCIFDGASSVLRIDGVQVAAGDIGSASLVGFSLAGYQPDGNLHWRDYFGEAVVFSGHHDATHISNMENYCSTNWGITIP